MTSSARYPTMDGERRILRLGKGHNPPHREVEVPTEAQMLQVALELHAKGVRTSTALMGWHVLYCPSQEQRGEGGQFDPFTGETLSSQPYSYRSTAMCGFGRKGEWEIWLMWSRGDDQPPTPIKLTDHLLPRGSIAIQADLLSWTPSARPEPASGALVEPAEPELSGALHEGARLRVESDHYERNPEARARCLAHYGKACVACAFDFGRVYGAQAAGFIHVHHLTPLATIAVDYIVDPVRDLRPVCPNCHAVIHLREPPYIIDEIRAILGRGNL